MALGRDLAWLSSEGVLGFDTEETVSAEDVDHSQAMEQQEDLITNHCIIPLAAGPIHGIWSIS